MNPKLRAMLAGLGLITVGGIGYLAVKVQPGNSVAALADAGFDVIFDPSILECQVRLAPECRDLPDGGLRKKYATVRTKVWTETVDAGVDGGLFNLAGQPLCESFNGNSVCRPPLLVFRWPRAGGRECFETVGPPDMACTLIERGCSIPVLCNDDGSGTQPIAAAQDRCACRDPSQGLCRVPNPDGGATPVLAPLGLTISSAFAGAGCVRKNCTEMFGDPGEWPAECPTQ